MYGFMKNVVKAAFHFEMNKFANIDKLIYDPLMYDYFIEENIDFKEDLAEILIKTKFHGKLKTNESTLKEIINRLPFDKKIIFNYKRGRLIIPHE